MHALYFNILCRADEQCSAATLTVLYRVLTFTSNNAHLCVMAQLQRKDSDDDLLAGWSSELDALLYSPEVEEAIKEVSPRY